MKLSVEITEYKTVFISAGKDNMDSWSEKAAKLEEENDELRQTNRVLLGLKDELEAENEALRFKANAVVNGASGGGFDKFSGFDDYVVPYQLIDELQDALLTGEQSED